MNILDNLYKVLVLVLLFSITIATYSLVGMNKKGGNFYTYKDTKINLLQVKKIHPRVSYYATLSSDSLPEINKLFSTTLNDKEIQNIEKFLKLSQDSEFYNIEIQAFMMFDDQKIELYKSPTYTKYARKYSVNPYLLETLKIYGLDDFQYANLLKIKDKIYTSKEKFLEDVLTYARLKHSHWSEKNIPILGLGEKAAKFMHNVDTNEKENLLDVKGISEILHGLKEANEKYLGIK